MYDSGCPISSNLTLFFVFANAMYENFSWSQSQKSYHRKSETYLFRTKNLLHVSTCLPSFLSVKLRNDKFSKRFFFWKRVLTNLAAAKDIP